MDLGRVKDIFRPGVNRRGNASWFSFQYVAFSLRTYQVSCEMFFYSCGIEITYTCISPAN